MSTYNPKEIEAKWQAFWRQQNTFAVKVEADKPKFYVLDMFPYPSGEGLHVRTPSWLYCLGYFCKV